MTIPCPGPFRSLYEAVWKIEEELGLLQRQIAGTYYWPLIRPRLLDMLSQRLGLLDLVQGRLRQGILRRTASELSPLLSHRKLSPWKLSGQFDTVLIPFTRKQMRGGLGVDVFSDRIMNEPEFGRLLVLDSCKISPMYRSAPGRFVRSRDYLSAQALIRAVGRASLLLPAVRRHRDDLGAAFKRRLGVDCPLSAEHFALRIAYFDEGRILGRRLMQPLGARRLAYVGTHGPSGLVAAAQDLGMETVELQHGLITPYHPAYHFVGRPHVPYAPDRLLTVGEFWECSAELPGNTRTSVIGSEEIHRASLGAVAKVAGRVVVLSQGTVGQHLLRAALSLAQKMPDREIVFRPHPQQRLGGPEQAYGAGFPAPPNFRVSGDHEDLHVLLAGSSVQIGVYSTSLVEGMVLGVRTVVLAAPGWEHFEEIVRQGDAALAETVEDIAAMLDSAPLARQTDRYYARPVPSIATLLSIAARGAQAGG